MTGYEVVKYRPEHKQSVAALQTHLWSDDVALNAAYFEWKYEENPYRLAEPAVYLVEAGGEIVGMRGFFGARWEAGRPPRAFRVFCADDLVIAPEHRNRGLFTALMRTAFADLANGPGDLALMLSAGSVTVLNSLAMGWKSIGPTHPVARASPKAARRRRALAYLGERRLVWRAAAVAESPRWRERERFTRLAANARRRSGAVPGVRLAPHAEPQRMADLVTRLGHDGRIRHVRDAPYFAWRFRNPLHEYRYLYAGERELQGYLVLQRCVAGRDLGRVHISDWEAVDTRTRASLLQAAVTWGEFGRFGTWTATLPDDACRLLREAGFVEASTGRLAAWPCVLARPFRAKRGEEWTLAGRPLLDLESWDLRMLYSMFG
jgi:GNAT superfamily N-acetyltransferase